MQADRKMEPWMLEREHALVARIARAIMPAWGVDALLPHNHILGVIAERLRDLSVTMRGELREEADRREAEATEKAARAEALRQAREAEGKVVFRDGPIVPVDPLRIPVGERQGPDSAAADMLYVFSELPDDEGEQATPVGFTLADVRDAQSAMRNAAKKLRVEGYPATADDLDHHANLLDGGAK